MLEDYQIKQKDDLKIKVSILLLLFFIVILIYVIIIFGNYFDAINQSNIHVYDYKKIVTEHYSHGEADIEKQTQENIKRILVDTQINVWTANDQINPKISALSDGNFVVLWQSYLQYSIIYGIYGQIFYSNGATRGTEFHVGNSTTLNQTYPSVAASLNGKFMVI